MKKVGDIIKDHANKKAPKSKRWQEVLRVINLPPKDREEYHRKTKIIMQQDKKRDIIPYTRNWIEEVEEDGKKKKIKRSKKTYCKVRQNERGEYIMVEQGEKVSRLGTQVFDLMKDADGYEWFKTRGEKKDESFEDVPF
jgi:hypothetical protein